jgi:hypothetical protein
MFCVRRYSVFEGLSERDIKWLCNVEKSFVTKFLILFWLIIRKPLLITMMSTSRAVMPILSLLPCYWECSPWVISFHLWLFSPCQQAEVSHLIRIIGICSINRQAYNCLIGSLQFIEILLFSTYVIKKAVFFQLCCLCLV